MLPGGDRGGLTRPRTLYVASGFAAVGLFLFFALAFFVAPQADDYCFSWMSQTRGVWGMAIHLYDTWSGRLFASVLAALPQQLAAASGLDLTGAYRATALAQFLVTVVLLALIAAIVLPRERGGRCWLLGLVFCFVVIANLRSPLGYMYWGTSGLTHGVTGLLAAFVIAVFYGAASARVHLGLIGAAGLGLLSLAAANGSEPIGGCIAIMVLCILAAVSERRALAPYATLIVLGAAAGTLIGALAPGDAGRLVATGGGDMLRALFIGPVAYLNYLALRIDTYGFLAWLLLIGHWAAGQQGAHDAAPPTRGLIARIQRHRMATALVAGLIGCGLFSFFVGAYGLGTGIPPRTQNILSLIAAVAGTAAAVDIGRRDGRRIGAWLRRHIARWLGADPLKYAVILMVMSLQAVYAALDLLGPAEAFAHEQRQRDALFDSAHGGVVTIPAYAAHPRLLFAVDVASESDTGGQWINACMANYYHLDTVRLASP